MTPQEIKDLVLAKADVYAKNKCFTDFGEGWEKHEIPNLYYVLYKESYVDGFLDRVACII